MKFLKRSVAASKRSAELALTQYREGDTDYTTVLIAQEALLNGEDRLADTLVLYGNVDIRLVALAFNDSERIADLLVEEGDR